jgi:hypothetical protein
MSVARLDPGPGRFEFARLWLAVRESFRPSGTLHVGPPSCIVVYIDIDYCISRVTRGSSVVTGRKKKQRTADQVDPVTGGEGEDVGAGDGGLAGGLHLRLDGVDDLEPADGVGVGAGALLAGEGGRVVEEDGAVAALAAFDKKKKPEQQNVSTRTFSANS